MKTGIVFGTFAPMTTGHLDLVMRAKKNNDCCYIVVCGYDGDRGEPHNLPLNTRYTIIKKWFKDDEIVRVIKIDDTELDIDESMSDSNWDIWIQAVKSQISDICDNKITWYVGEEDYYLKLNEHTSDMVDYRPRTFNLISGTLCRAKPIKYWFEMAQPFREYFSHNILIAGTASEGKTTLVQDIGKYFSCPYSYEKGRDIYDNVSSDEEFNINHFIYNIYEQNKLNHELISSPANHGVFISDSDNVVTLMYAYFYSKRKNFAIKPEEYDVLYNFAATQMRHIKWDKIFLIKPRIKAITDDGQRYMPDSDYQIRVEFYEFLKKTYDEFGYEYEELDGDYYTNYLKVRNYIDGLYR